MKQADCGLHLWYNNIKQIKAVNNMSAQKTITRIEKKQHILVCLSASPSNEKIVQTAAKMAKVLDARFTAIYVQNDFALT